MVKICASIYAGSDKEALSLVEEAVKSVDIVEIRADALEDQSFENIKELLEKANIIANRKKENGKKEIILTLRKRDEGGNFKGSENERIKIISNLLESNNFDFIDIELSCGESVVKEIVEKTKKNDKKVIISYHDFEKTPEAEEILEIMRKELSLGADIAKIATKANSYDDALKIFKACIKAKKEAKSSGKEFCFIGMGEHGKITRICAPFFGSALTYGYVEGSKEAAPGQISVEKLRIIFDLLW